MNTILNINAEICAGSSLEDTVFDTIRLANFANCVVSFKFNGINIWVHGLDDPAIIMAKYFKTLKGNK